MINPGRIITHALRRPGPNKHTPRILHHGHHSLRALDLQDQMLRRVLVAQPHRLFNGPDLQRHRMRNRPAHDVHPRQRARLRMHLRLDGLHLCLLKPHGNQHHLRIAAVFRLAEQITRHERRLGALVRNDEHLAGARGHIDADARARVVGDDHLGRRDELVARPKDLVDFGDAFGAVGEGGDGLGAPGQDDAGGADFVRDVDDFRGDGSVRARGRGEDDFLAAGYHGGDAEHEGRGGEDGGAARDVEADAFDGAGEAGAGDPGHGFDLEGFRFLLGGVEAADVFEAGVDG